MAKYLNADQRETIIWVHSLMLKLLNDGVYWNSKGKKLLNKQAKLLEELILNLLDGIDAKDGKMVVELAKKVKPVLIVEDFSITDDKITVDAGHYYTLAEHALEYCLFQHMIAEINKMTNAKKIKEFLKENYKCRECNEPSTCQLRQVLLHFQVPPLAVDGKCQYWRGD